MIEKTVLENLYINKKQSVPEVAESIGVSSNTVIYWMNKHSIPRRTRSDANYIKSHPNGDPFERNEPETIDEAKLYGLGVGIYWGEGNKASKNSVRVGNTDPKLLETFIVFLEKFYSIPRKNLTFGLQLFSDINPKIALTYWQNQLGINGDQFYKPTISLPVSRGTYRKKCKYGVLTVYFNNTKLKKEMMSLLPR